MLPAPAASAAAHSCIRTTETGGGEVEIEGKKAVVVGGASGMARATAELLHHKGASIAILDLPTSAGEEVASALGGTFHPVDVMDDEGVERAIGDAVGRLGGLHVAVNTAGGGIAMRTLTKNGPHPIADFRRVIELNLVATFNLNRLQADAMSRNEPKDGERVFESHGSSVVVDAKSLAFIDGARVDYASEGLKRAFKVENPNAEGTCGCGESFNMKAGAA